MGSVARLLKEYGFEVKALRGGRFEVIQIAGAAGNGNTDNPNNPNNVNNA
jgi:hypothetical protein